MAPSPSSRVQASTLHVRDAYVRERFGGSAGFRLRGEATPALRAALDAPPPPDGWVDFALFVEMNLLVDKLFGTGDLALVAELGRYGARNNAGVWRSLFERGVDPVKFSEIAPGLWHKHYDSGTLLREVRGPRSVTIEIASFPTPHRAHCRSVVGWLEGVFEFCTAVRVLVNEECCRASGQPRCVIELTWL